MQTLINLANLVAALAVLYMVICACHAMSRRTRPAIAYAYIAIGVGAFGSGIGPWFEHVGASEPELLGNLGIALLLFATRRKVILSHARSITG